MHPFRFALPVVLLASAFAQGTQAPAASSVATRIAMQNAFFDRVYQETLKENPELATAVGDYRYNDQLGDHSLASIVRRHDRSLKNLAEMQAISSAGFPEQDLISHDLMIRNLKQGMADYDFKEYEMPVNQMGGPHTGFADLPLSMPFDSVKHYEDYIARLKQVPRAFDESIEIMKAGEKDGLMPVKFLLEKIPAQCDGVVNANPFALPTKKFPASFSGADKKRLTEQINDAVSKQVFPAYRNFAKFIQTDYAPHGRTTLAVTSLPDGQRRYQNDILGRTTTNIPAAEIHAIGLREMARIEGLMTDIAHKQGYKDLATFRAAVEADPKYIPTSSQQIVDDFAKYIAQMQPRLSELFTVLPKAPVTVEAIPAFQSAMATHYNGGTPDGKRPGRVVVATSEFGKRSLINDEAVAYHEGVPGHHMQISISQELTGLPKFRQHSGNSGYIEGWALYAEELGKEIGFYKDPVSDYGRLRSELFRAVRLVVDTGIHNEGWSREKVVDFMRQSGAVDEATIQAETDRYIAWPGQALSYKLGQLKIRELRERARTQLGPAFNIRTFHDEILNGGALPLDVLDARINRWIKGQLPAQAAK